MPSQGAAHLSAAGLRPLPEPTPLGVITLGFIVFPLERRLRVCQARDISKHSQFHLAVRRVRVPGRAHCVTATRLKARLLQGGIYRRALNLSIADIFDIIIEINVFF